MDSRCTNSSDFRRCRRTLPPITLVCLGYGLLFCIALPTLLALWAARLDTILPLPSLPGMSEGWWLVGAGIALITWSMLELWRVGRGLPMNAFPPLLPVQSGPYRWLEHPIYVGAVIVAAGTSVGCGSFAGVAIVTPALALACAALVLGFERLDLLRRFGEVPGGVSARWPSTDDSAPPSGSDLVAVLLRLLLPFMVLYEAVGHLPVPDAIDVMHAVERRWPVWTWTTIAYTAVYPFVLLAVVLAPTRCRLRTWCFDAWLGVAVGLLCYLVIPLVAVPRPFDAEAPLGWLLTLERADGLAGRAACPSFHVFWAVMAAMLIGQRGRVTAALAGGSATLICASCVTTGMHAIIDVVTGVLLAIIALHRRRLWALALRTTERVANSWREWHIGPVRVIVHGTYAGLAAALGVAIISACGGASRSTEIGLIALASLVGAGLWGQYWVGSRTLLRPFGYFGSVIAVALASAALLPFGFDGWTMAAAVAVAAPWVQAVGRLRCLVQGCCHGARCEAGRGIVYRHPRSRVITVAQMGSVEVIATPLVSISSNVVIGAIIARLWSLGAPSSGVIGMYLVLAGFARFAEEAYRGEPQTRVIGGLRFYQWCGLALVILGAAISCIATAPVPLASWPDSASLALAVAIGVVHWFAMGVDFPRAQRRFARLV